MPITFNPRQLEAVEHVHGPMLVVAGAGTGKTTVLVQRIARLIRERHAQPQEILALTFTDNAAAEMAERVRSELAGTDTTGLRASTFHAYCVWLLERTRHNFAVLEKEDLWIYLRQRMKKLPFQHFAPARNPGEFLDALLEFFDRCQDDLVDPSAFQAWVDKLGDGPVPRVARASQLETMSHEEQVSRWREIAKVCTRVEQMLTEEGLGTFGHQISRTAALLRCDPEMLAFARARARFLLIDEFQDVNVAQVELAQLLAGDSRNIFAVGDPDQAIYHFRGATAAAFTEFQTRFPETRTVVLKDNQRSRTPILKCGYSIIWHNPAAGLKRFGREPLESVRDERDRRDGRRLPQQPVLVVEPGSDEQEAADIAQAIEEVRRRPPRSKHPQVAVLYRMHDHRECLVKELQRRGIPLAVTGIDAMDTCEIRDLFACLRVMQNPSDSSSLFRVAALPVFAVDPERLRELMSASPEEEFAEMLAQVPGGPQIIATIEAARAATLDGALDAQACVVCALRTFRFDTGHPALRAFVDVLAKWLRKPIRGSGTLQEFLDYISLLPQAGGVIALPTDEQSDDPGVVRLMTAHAAKGLEFEHVFILRLTSGPFPLNYRPRLFEFPRELRRGMVMPDGKEIHAQEERRLFYVAMTRARDSLTLSTRPGRGKKNPRPTGFVRDLMDDAAAKEFWQKRKALPLQLEIAAAAAPDFRGVGRWLLMPPVNSPLATKLSASSIERYEACPLRFKIDYNWRLPGAVAAQMQFGDVMHRVLRDYMESVRDGRAKTADQVVECLCEVLSDTHFDDRHQRDLYQQEGEEQLREFVRLREARPPVEVVATERRFEFKMGEVRVVGRVDRIDRIEGKRVAIVDYKTGTPRTEERARTSLQLSLYALAARELWGLVPERLVFYNLYDNTSVESSRSEVDLGLEKERVRLVAEGIAQGHFDAKPGRHCRWCPYREFCPYTEEQVYASAAAQAVGGK